jgi:lysophospholipid acyltransferase (LPLAT)-like uncharacterized protein
MSEPQTSAQKPKPRTAAEKRADRRRRMRIFRRTIGLSVIGALGPPALRRLHASWKRERLDAQHWDAIGAGHKGVLLALWHGRMVCGMPDYAKREFAVLVSHSHDGELIARMLARFGYRTIRGSSSKGGARAVREMLGQVRSDAVIVITPDGPRGPRHSMNPGLAWLARETGFPVLPLGYACDKAWRLKSWDRFTIPKFGARVVTCFGEPVRVAQDADAEELGRATQAIREGLLGAETRAFAQLGKEPDW